MALADQQENRRRHLLKQNFCNPNAVVRHLNTMGRPDRFGIAMRGQNLREFRGDMGKVVSLPFIHPGGIFKRRGEHIHDAGRQLV